MPTQLKFILAVFVTVFAFNNTLFAEFTSATLGIDGLTCSACSFGTEKSIRKLDFVEDVKMNLNKNIAEITFRKGKNVSIDALVKKVYDAGFSVRFVEAIYYFEQPVSINKNIFKAGATTFYVLKSGAQSLKGNVKMHFVAEKYVPKKELQQWKSTLASARGEVKDAPLYFITIL